MKNKYIQVLQKLCATITSLCFTVTIITNNSFAAVNPETTKSQQQYFESKDKTDFYYLFPSKYGKIISYNDNFSDTVIINIQDLHCDYSVQKNISEILAEISKKYNIETVYVEGGIGNIDTSLLANINSQNKQDVLEKLLKSGKLTGTEYYSAINNKTNLLKGVEDKEIYDKNIQRLSTILNSKKETERVLTNISREIDFLKAKYLNSENKKFSKLLQEYETGEIKQKQWVYKLTEYARNNKINLNNYPNLNMYLTVIGVEFNGKKVQKELTSLLTEIKKSVSYVQYQTFIKETQNLTNITKLKIFTEEFCEKQNINLQKKYPNLAQYFILKEKSLKYNPVQLVQEERKLMDVLRTYLSETDTELEISYLSDFENFYKGYITASLTENQWEYVKLGLDKFKELYSKYSIQNDVEKLEKYSNILNEFYAVNTERNRIFIKNMKLSTNSSVAHNLSSISSSNLHNILGKAKNIVVLVAGGYHTDGITEILNEKNISNITITPNISNSTKSSRAQYEYLAQQQVMSVKQMIALGLISNATEKEQILTIINSLMPNRSLDGVDINMLVQQLNQIFFQHITVSLITDENKLEFTLQDGSKYSLNIDDDLISIIEKQNRESFAEGLLIQTEGEDLKEVVNLVSKATFNYGTGIFAPQIYQISKDVCLFMVNNKGYLKWYLGNGAVWEIANSKYSGQTLDGVEPIVYEYMPEVVQKAIASRQAVVDIKNKKSLSNRIFDRILSLIIVVALMLNLTGCDIQRQEEVPNGTEPASIIEINDYTKEAENIINLFSSRPDQGYFAYLPSFMTQEDKDEWDRKDFYYVEGLINTFDQANAAILFLKMGNTEKAGDILRNIVQYNCKAYEIKRVSGRKETLYRIRKSNKEPDEILGEIVWVGLAAIQYKLVTGSTEFDNLIKTVDEYLVTRECVEGAGYYMGSSVKYFTSGGYSSAEHQLDIMAYFTLKNLLPDDQWKGVVPEHIVSNVLPKNVEFKTATDEQISEMIKQTKKENSALLFNACRAFYKNMYKINGVVRGYNDFFLVLDPNSWGIQVLSMIKEYAPSIQIEENGVMVEKPIYEASELSKIDLNSLLEKAETNFFVTDEELQANLSNEEYQKFKGYHLYTWSKEKFVDGKLNWSFEWSMQLATAYYLMGNREQAQLILNDAQMFANEMGLYTGLLPASNVNGVKNYSDYGWKIPRAPSFAATITSIMLQYGLLNADPSYASPFFPVIDVAEEVPSSILPSTIKKINDMISKGTYSTKGALKTIIKSEILKSFFTPIHFVIRHYQTKGAEILVVATVIMFLFSFGMFLSLVPPVMAAIASFIVALTTNVSTHVIMDYRFLKSIGLSEAINLYGKDNVKLTNKGNVLIDNKAQTIPIYVINDKPKNAKDFNFKSVPIKVKAKDGKYVKCWIGNYNDATILFADGADYEVIVKEFGKTRQFETIYGKKTALKANIDIIEIDMNNPESGLSYSQSGNIIVGSDMVRTGDIVDLQKEISLLRNKIVETVTINQNVAVYIDDELDNISSSQDFIDVINLYMNNNDLGVNAKILFNDKFFAGDKVNGKKGFLELLEQEYGSSEAADKEFIRIIEQLKQENKEIVVVFDETAETANLNKYRQYGIFSYIANNEYVDGLTQNKNHIKFVTNLNQIYGFDGSLSIIKVSAFKEELTKSSGIFTFLTSSLNLKEYIKTRNINFVRQVANNFDFDQIPVIDIEQIAQILTDSENKFKDLSKYLNGSDSISVYYLGLSDDEQRTVFMEEILKRALVVNYLRNYKNDEAYYGLKNKTLEDTLAKALIEKYKSDKTFNVANDKTLDESVSMAQLQFNLLQEISELSQKAFIQEIKTERDKENKTRAIDDIINLIPLYAERNMEFRSATNIDMVDIKNIKGILSAA